MDNQTFKEQIRLIDQARLTLDNGGDFRVALAYLKEADRIESYVRKESNEG